MIISSISSLVKCIVHVQKSWAIRKEDTLIVFIYVIEKIVELKKNVHWKKGLISLSEKSMLPLNTKVI